MNEPMIALTLFQIIAGLLTSGAAGALINNLVTKKRVKTDLTLKILEEYLANFELHNHVKDRLNNFEEYKEGNSDEHKRERNKVVKVGNWFEIYTVLYKKNMIDKKLVQDLNFDLLIKDFVSSVKPYIDTLKASGYWKNMMSMKW